MVDISESLQHFKAKTIIKYTDLFLHIQRYKHFYTFILNTFNIIQVFHSEDLTE